MKRLQLVSLAAVVLAMVCASGSVFAQSSTSASASATIVTPIAIQRTADLNYGNVAASFAGTVIMSPASSRLTTGGITLPQTTGSVGAATFEVTGQDYTYSITLPTGDYIITRIAGAATMVVNSFTSSPLEVGTISGGSETVTVGATLHVGDGQTPGTYTNATGFNVTVNYN